jgi:biotin carboxyl carrier protein
MSFEISVDGKPVEIPAEAGPSVLRVEPGVYSVLHAGRSYEARVTAVADGFSVEVNGRRFHVEVRDPRNARRRSDASLRGGRQNILAPMPGKVVRLLVQAGDSVEAGQGLVVVEAMKMQNEMKCAHAGTVREVRAAAGDTVVAGQVLVVIE